MSDPASSPPSVSPASATPRGGKGPRFWLIMLSVCITMFLYALELTAVSTALPVIANALHASQFIWVGSSYALASTAILPMSGGLAEIFGRRPTVLLCITLFCVGSAICGAAVNMNMLIAGRTVQGLGGGGIQGLAFIILADLVSLEERGIYSGIFGIVFCTACFIGPVVGGSLAAQGNWRWLFYLNLPICGLSAALVAIFMQLPTPADPFYDKVRRLDWIGNLIVVGSTTSCTIALTWGGIVSPWGSVRVLVPLILGLFGLVGFIVYEAKVAEFPLVPFAVMSNRTSVSGYLQMFFAAIVAMGAVYMLPVYYEACKGASAVGSGVLILGLSTLAPTFMIAGVSVRRTQKYRPQMFLGWLLMMIGLGLMSTLSADSNKGKAVGYTVFLGIGIGFLYATTIFPVQAPLPVTLNASSMAFFLFIRSFATVWGITIGSVVLQNQLNSRLLSNFLAQFPNGVSVAYSIIPTVSSLPPDLRRSVRVAFANSLQVFWQVLIGIAGMGLLSAVLMKGLPLSSKTDAKWDIHRDESAEGIDIEKDRIQ